MNDIKMTDLKIMTDLIAVYDAAEKLFELCSQITGDTLSSGSIVAELLKITNVINHLSPRFDPEVDWEESIVGTVLGHKELSAEERAQILIH